MVASTQSETGGGTATDDMIPLGNNIYLFEPTEEDQSADKAEVATNLCGAAPPSPSLIILCTWLGGATRSRVAKYTSWYRNEYPTAHILLIRTVFLDLSARSFATVRARLRPARDAITRIIRPAHVPKMPHGSVPDVSDVRPGILLHIFSHGGCNTAIQLAISLNEEAGPLLHEHLKQIVLDSCPGDESFEKAYSAALVSLPPALSGNAFGAVAAYTSVGVITALQHVGLMSSVTDMRRNLNDPALFGTRARRVYLVSRRDRMVAVEDVLAHAQAARTSGNEVGLMVFNEAPHCGLIMEDAERYWGAIRDSWVGKELPLLPTDDQARYGPML